MTGYVLSLDLETRSVVDLTARGVHIYARNPSTRILCGSYSFDQGRTIAGRWRPWRGKPMPSDLADALRDRDVEIQGWNAVSFERLLLKCVAKIDVEPERFHDTMQRARSMALPAKLELCARALEMPVKKSDDSVMRKWMKPLPDGSWAADPGEYEQLCQYCDYDVMTEGGIGRLLRPLSAEERIDCTVNERINDRGLMVDIALARAAQRYAKDEMADICDRLNILTRGGITGPKQHVRIKKWLGENLPSELAWVLEPDEKTGKVSFDAAAREELLSAEHEDDLVGETRELIELVHDGGKASTAKFATMQSVAGEDQRVRGAYNLNGAGQTGRFSSTKLQVHNYIRASLPNIEDVIEAILRGDDRDGLIRLASYDKDGGLAFTDGRRKERIQKPYNMLSILSRTLRPSIIAASGNVLVWRDWSAIEARVLPWLSAENTASQVLDVFASGKDIYRHQATMSFGVDIGDVTDVMRQGGKIQCIAEGQLVLTDRGLVPIERVEKSDQTWDGFRWTCHEGVVYKGVQDVWEYQGLVATEEHLVFTKDGRTLPFGICARQQIPLAQTGIGRRPLRLGYDRIANSSMDRRSGQSRPSTSICAHENAMRQLRRREMAQSADAPQRVNQWLSNVFETKGQCSRVANQADGGGKVALRKLKRSELQELWRSRDTFQIQECNHRSLMGAEKYWFVSRSGDRSQEQRKALRARQSEMVNERAKYSQYQTNGHGRTSGMEKPLFVADHISNVESRIDEARHFQCRSFSGSGKAEKLAQYCGKTRVYDIVNAGPNHRFTVSDILVHNCLSFGFGGGAGAGMRMARVYNLDIDERTAEGWKNAWRQTNPWASRFWKNLEVAAFMAVRNPDTVYPAGRVSYLCTADVLWCMLPSGRMISYPFPKIVNIPGRWGPADTITCMKASYHPKKGTNYWPRMKLWGGILAQGVTQAEAASLLRWARREVDANDWPQIGDTHDEILLEVREDEEEEAQLVLKDIMDNPPYEIFAGLPLASEGASGYAYKSY